MAGAYKYRPQYTQNTIGPDPEPMNHEQMRTEAQMHLVDYSWGTPLDIGYGYTVAFHANDCPYCAYLQAKGLSHVISAEELEKRALYVGGKA
jgi:hypothetical protein